jgi:putative DNA primase/helicase
MIMNIFAQTAPKYWERGVPVIPLEPVDKRPVKALYQWQKYAHAMPSQDEQDNWPLIYRNSNIGLPCGPQSGIMVIDYDYNDPRVEAAILSVLPRSPWKRVGQKGFILAYKYNGQPTKNIYEAGDKCVVQILSVGAQFVLPPSIHPKTNQPYTANCELLDVLDQLPLLPVDTEDRLRTAISQILPLKEKGSGINGKFKFLEKVPSGSRDNRMNQAAGLFAQSVLKGQVPLKEALDLMQGWFDNNVEVVENDTIDVNKGKAQIVQYVIKGVMKQNRILPPGWDEGLTDEEIDGWGLKFGDEHKEWPYEDIIKHINTVHGNFPVDDPEISKMETFILSKLAKSKNINAIQESKILKTLKGTGKANPSDYKRVLKQLKSGPIEGISHLEIANEVIKEMEVMYGQMAFWEDTIWRWEGSKWEPMYDHVVRSVVQSDFGNLELSKRFSDHKGILGVIRDQLNERSKPALDVRGINFSNGFLNVNGTLMAHAPEFGMTYTLPFAYEPTLAGKCPMFMKFLDDSWGQDPDFKEKKEALQEAISATLFGAATQYQKCFLLQGTANSGKSVLMHIISSMVSEDAYCAISPEDWGDKFIPAQFTGKLLNIAGELHETKRIDGKRFKEIIAGDQITVQHKQGTPFKLKPKTAHWFASNHLPRTADTSYGFTRRWLIFKFDHVVPKEKIDRELASKIVYEEIEAVVAWAIEGWERLKKSNNYTSPASNEMSTNEMALQNSSVRQWMDQRLLYKDNVKTKEIDLFRDYWVFCGTTGNRAASAKVFNTELKSFLGEMCRQEGQYEDGQIIHYGLALKAGDR